MTSDAIPAKGIKVQMPHPILTCVFGKPTHKQVKMVIRELSANVMAISCPWGHSKGHLGFLQDPAIYLARNGEVFNIKNIELPAYPVIPAGSMTTKREELHVFNAAICKAWSTYKMVLTITRNQFVAGIDDVYYTLLLTTPPTVSIPLISAPLSCTSPPPMPRSANLIWMKT
jgi:hypothetical protein